MNRRSNGTGTLLGAALAIGGIVPSASAEGWTQLYGGLSIGVNAFTGDAQVVDKSGAGSVLKAGGPFGSDIGGSATLGGDYQVNRWLVLGAFATYDWSGAAIRVKVNEASAGVSGNASVVSIEDMWTVGGRVGVLIGNNTLVYGLAGYSWINVDDLKASLTAGGSTESFRLPLPNSKGVTLGGGVEHKLSENVSLRAEYRMTDYGRESIYDDANVAVTGRATSHLARVGAFYRLGGGGTEEPATAAGDRWAGLYAGAGLGLAAYPRELDVRGNSAGHFDDYFSITGLGGGNILTSISGGYDFRVAPRIVAGLVASVDFAAGRHGLAVSSGGSEAKLDLLNQKHSWSVGGRLGYLLSPSLLGFVTAGFTQVQFDNASLTLDGADVFRFPFPRLAGGFVGVGFENMLTAAWSLRSEYQFTQFETHTVSAFETPGGDSARVRFEPSSHAVKMSLSYRFAGGN